MIDIKDVARAAMVAVRPGSVPRGGPERASKRPNGGSFGHGPAPIAT